MRKQASEYLEEIHEAIQNDVGTSQRLNADNRSYRTVADEPLNTDTITYILEVVDEYARTKVQEIFKRT